MSAEDYSAGPEREFASRPQREAAAAERMAELREQLRDLLADVVGIPLPGELATAFLALAASVPEEMRARPKDLCRRLEQDFAGELGARMWRDRWQSAVEFVPVSTRRTGGRTRRRVFAWSSRPATPTVSTRHGGAYGCVRERQQLQAAVERSCRSVAQVVDSLERAMLVDIAALRTKKRVLEYVEEGMRERPPEP